jgi:hypothetical protein
MPLPDFIVESPKKIGRKWTAAGNNMLHRFLTAFTYNM